MDDRVRRYVEKIQRTDPENNSAIDQAYATSTGLEGSKLKFEPGGGGNGKEGRCLNNYRQCLDIQKHVTIHVPKEAYHRCQVVGSPSELACFSILIPVSKGGASIPSCCCCCNP